ncbi:MAG: S1C family serine protease [Patescibacteria group bacterium]
MRAILIAVFCVFYLMAGVVYAEEGGNAEPACKTPYMFTVSGDAIKKWENAMRYVPERLVLKFRLSFKDANGFPREDIINIQGGGFIFGDYLVTVEHMKPLPPDALVLLLISKGYRNFTDVKVKETWFEILYAYNSLVIGGTDALEFVATSEKFHLSLYKLAVVVPPKYRFALTFGDTACLRIGVAVILGGNPGSFGRNFRIGYVSSLKGGKIENVSEADTSLKKILEEATFMVQLPIIPGDSGHPVVSITATGEIALIGVAFTTIPGAFYGDMRLVLKVETVKAFFQENGVKYVKPAE